MAATDTPYIRFCKKIDQEWWANKLENFKANDKGKAWEQVPDTFLGKTVFSICSDFPNPTPNLGSRNPIR